MTENKYRYKNEKGTIEEFRNIKEILEQISSDHAQPKAKIYTERQIFETLEKGYISHKNFNDFGFVKVDKRTKKYRFLSHKYTDEEIENLVYVTQCQYTSSYAVMKSKNNSFGFSFYPMLYVLRDNINNYFFCVTIDKSV